MTCFSDDATFRTLYRSHAAFVWRNLSRLGVPTADLEDKTQEVFVIAYRRRDSFEDRGHGARAWLFQISVRVASEARRHRRRHPEDPESDPSLLAFCTHQREERRIEARDALAKVLGRLDEKKRALLMLYEVEHRTANEIAELLEIPANTVYSRLRAARAAVEEVIAEMGRAA
jgi:RNA polymerase sigma-70 factor, ECF subfamily